MSELTTEKAIGIIADDLCFETGGIDEPHTNGCAQEAVAKAWLEQVKREAKVEALRDAAGDIYLPSEGPAMYVDIAYAERLASLYLKERAERIEKGSK